MKVAWGITMLSLLVFTIRVFKSTKYIFRMLKKSNEIQQYVLLMTGAMDARNMYSNLAVNE